MKVPEIEIDDSFWDERMFNFEGVIDSEAIVNSHLYQIIRRIIKALGLNSHLQVILDVPTIMDKTPDVSIRTKVNKIIIGTVEGKKPPKGPNGDEEREKIFGSDTAVAGEVFEQLCVCKIQLGADTVGLVSTLNGFQLLSTKDLSNEGTLTMDKAKSAFEGKNKDTDNDNNQNSSSHGQRAPKKRKAETDGLTESKPKGSNENTEDGKVSIIMNEADDKRQYFASEVFSFGNKEEQNKNVFKLLATFILLCVKSLEESLRQKVDYSKTCNIRVRVDTQNATFNFTQVCLHIQFNEMPSKKYSKFYVIRQLGYGNGSCCLACTEYSEPCTVKFFHRRRRTTLNKLKEASEAEVENWKEMYCSDYSFPFVEVLQIGECNILVMPLLRVPAGKSEKELLLERDTESLTYKALLHFRRKGYIHNDLGWHHIGVISMQKSQPMKSGHNLRSGKTELETIEKEDVVIWCDLGSGGVVKCDNAAEQ